MEKFEIDDKVKVVRLDTTRTDYVSDLNKYLGCVGIIRAMQIIGKELCVEFDNGASWWFCPDWLELVKKKQKGWTGKVVCTEVYFPCMNYFEIGKVYEVKNGLLIDKTGTPYDSVHPYDSAADLIQNFEKYNKYYRFIEFKGFCKNGKE